MDQSLELTAEAEALVKQKAEAQARAMLNPVHDGQVVSTVNQKLRLCDVCGAFLSIFDSDRYPHRVAKPYCAAVPLVPQAPLRFSHSRTRSCTAVSRTTLRARATKGTC